MVTLRPYPSSRHQQSRSISAAQTPADVFLIKAADRARVGGMSRVKCSLSVMMRGTDYLQLPETGYRFRIFW
ncbi:hypothetical protein Q8A67_021341 [Cirrhinus molitorella]|uniref:Uncharacterized protein n=1 Tax=Cirrhinus molitorella TaxID=172907 RepID=A0AA88P5L1_9TELE|nr:hypothetical protein Q8A67_021341 [Cirrhinus molitorella]